MCHFFHQPNINKIKLITLSKKTRAAQYLQVFKTDFFPGTISTKTKGPHYRTGINSEYKENWGNLAKEQGRGWGMEKLLKGSIRGKKGF